ncbi:MAG: hypothetical protein A2W86_05700 [Bacteroidetes bacterium GWD2_45_23]|nr:MAG: hypothetical protein A2W87_12935 [Bacteroidetes bacterium GWC2_46_850]OFX87655.1 MAG: hypothetical protein A2W86_05700 [Bacteroidetes bacterium GWD2_45_23]HBB01379.1 hypothetical protein [Porphyromonadaceae bacterium]HCC19172.1 hypothetical protein [Porphyromonadaceae bacterium]
MKKIFFNFLMFAALLTPVLLTSCGEDDNNGTNPVEDNKLSGSIKDTRTLDANVEYLLTGPLLVEEGGILNIPAGTTIKAQQGFSNYILVLQGGKINARGTATAPVKMIADKEGVGQGYWGGLIINGRAPLASPSEVGSTEVNSAYVYGGTNAADNSGELSYVILGNTGARSSADVEHNGITLNGVGSGTKINDLYIYDGADDAVEFFGGSVNVSNLLAVNSDDDMFDFTQGYKGTLKNAYGIWEAGYTSGESDPRGIEADGNLDGNYATHPNQSDFRVENMTVDLRLAASSFDAADKSKRMQDVIKIRRGAKATVVNALVKGTGTVEDLVDLTDSKGGADVGTTISLTNALTNAPQRQTNPVVAVGVTIGGSNTGCPTNIFAWTGYQF